MDWASWFLLVIAVIYFLFKIKNIYSFIVWCFHENGKFFTFGLFLLVFIFILGVTLAFTAPQYGWIPRWAFIAYIIGFFACRFLFGIPK